MSTPLDAPSGGDRPDPAGTRRRRLLDSRIAHVILDTRPRREPATASTRRRIASRLLGVPSTLPPGDAPAAAVEGMRDPPEARDGADDGAGAGVAEVAAELPRPHAGTAYPLERQPMELLLSQLELLDPASLSAVRMTSRALRRVIDGNLALRARCEAAGDVHRIRTRHDLYDALRDASGSDGRWHANRSARLYALAPALQGLRYHPGLFARYFDLLFEEDSPALLAAFRHIALRPGRLPSMAADELREVIQRWIRGPAEAPGDIDLAFALEIVRAFSVSHADATGRARVRALVDLVPRAVEGLAGPVAAAELRERLS